VNNNLSH